MGKLEQRKLKEINFINLFGLLREMKKKMNGRWRNWGGIYPILLHPNTKFIIINVL